MDQSYASYLLTDCLPQIIPYLDRECCARILLVCKTAHNLFRSDLTRSHSKEFDALVDRWVGRFSVPPCFPKFKGHRSFKDGLIPQGSAEEFIMRFTTALAKRGAIVHVHAVQESSRFQRNRFFKESYDHLVKTYWPTVFLKIEHTELTGYGIALWESGVDEYQTPTRLDFHLHHLTFMCHRSDPYSDYDENHFEQCDAGPLLKKLILLDKLDAGIDLVVQVNDSVATNYHVDCLLKHWSRESRQRERRVVIGPNLNALYNSDPQGIRNIVIVIGYLENEECIAELRQKLVLKYAYTGRPCLNIHILAENPWKLLDFHRSWNENPLLYDTDRDTLFPETDPQYDSLKGTALTKFEKDVYRLDEIRFSFRLPSRLPYRISVPEFDRSNAFHFIYKGLYVKLINYTVKQPHRQPSVAWMSVAHEPESIWRFDLVIEANQPFSQHTTGATGPENYVRQFEKVFWILTGNHWFNYPHSFVPQPGLYNILTEEDSTKLGPAERYRSSSRDSSPKRKYKVKG